MATLHGYARTMQAREMRNLRWEFDTEFCEWKKNSKREKRCVVSIVPNEDWKEWQLADETRLVLAEHKSPIVLARYARMLGLVRK